MSDPREHGYVTIGNTEEFQKYLDAVRQTNTARGVLDLIDERLVNLPPQERAKLWDVLTALRGPDFEDKNEELKKATTCHIRSKAFPLCRQASVDYKDHTDQATVYLYGLAYFAKNPKPVKIDYVPFGSGKHHFMDHLNRAAHALNFLEF